MNWNVLPPFSTNSQVRLSACGKASRHRVQTPTALRVEQNPAGFQNTKHITKSILTSGVLNPCKSWWGPLFNNRDKDLKILSLFYTFPDLRYMSNMMWRAQKCPLGAIDIIFVKTLINYSLNSIYKCMFTSTIVWHEVCSGMWRAIDVALFAFLWEKVDYYSPKSMFIFVWHEVCAVQCEESRSVV